MYEMGPGWLDLDHARARASLRHLHLSRSPRWPGRHRDPQCCQETRRRPCWPVSAWGVRETFLVSIYAVSAQLVLEETYHDHLHLYP